jgi:predicted glycosyltransferase involved in capsule biosynthesis
VKKMSLKESKKIIDLLLEDAVESKKVNHESITVCIAIRATEINPWVISRLEFGLNYYNPRPNFVIVDFGSDNVFSLKIKEVCFCSGAKYIYEDDNNIFSLAKARNIAAQNVDTDLIFFSDLDYIYDSKFFSELANAASLMKIRQFARRVITMPIYHLNKEYTCHLESLECSEKIDEMLFDLTCREIGSEFGEVFEFIAPYSNAFLIHKDFYNISGGYCNEFRGHGSEDFEYLIRLAMLSSDLPIPESLEKDFFGPSKDSFFYPSPYLGFRKYLEALTTPYQLMGFKAYHLWHEKPSDAGYWTTNNDWKRIKFNEILNKYISEYSNLLKIDYIPRSKKALCIFDDKNNWGYFIPLRLYDFELVSLSDSDNDSLSKKLLEVESMEYDVVCIFNPYMKSHSRFRGLIELARRLKIEIIVIERGAIPNSIYYSAEVAYADEDYKKTIEMLEVRTCKNVVSTKAIIKLLKRGGASLEKMACYEETWSSHSITRHDVRLKVLIPLQLEDDMAVNFFVGENITYLEFVSQIEQVALENPEILFLIKKHPLDKNLNIKNSENVLIVENDSNIHAIIDFADAVFVYNSGVGLLSLLHGKPTFNVGNAYYESNKYLSIKIENLFTGISLFLSKKYKENREEKIVEFFDWLIFEKYSWFTAKDVIKEFQNRFGHAYKDICVERISVRGSVKSVGRGGSIYEYSNKSYQAHLLGGEVSKQSPKVVSKQSPNFLSKNKLRKFFKHPYLFFRDLVFKRIVN